MSILKDLLLSDVEDRKIGQIIQLSGSEATIRDSFNRRNKVVVTPESSYKIGDSVVVLNSIIIGLSHEESEVSLYIV